MANYRLRVRLPPDGKPATMPTNGIGEAQDLAHHMIELGASVDIYDLTGPVRCLVKSDTQLRAEKKNPRS